MYFPYLRGKQEEQLAIVEAGFLSSVVLPVFEPTNLARAFTNRYRRIAEAGRRFALIVNSQHGKPAPSMPSVLTALDTLEADVPGKALPALEIRPETDAMQIKDFVQGVRDRQSLFVHRNHFLSETDLKILLRPLAMTPVHLLLAAGGAPQHVRNLPAAGFALVRDGFARQATNAQYPKRSNFDDLMYTYVNQGFQGFGDFAIIGDHYSPGGGAAKHVTLHLTEELGTGPTIVTNHFVSSTPPHRGGNNQKYLDALRQLVQHTSSPPKAPFATAGVRAYHESHRHRHFPGLGVPKRWSILHHLEVVNAHLTDQGAQPFI